MATHEKDHGAGEELERVARPAEVPHRGRRPEAHGVVPEGGAGGGVQDSDT